MGPEDHPLSYLTGLKTGIFSCLQIHKASATIIEPAGESDNPLRFTSGLVVALDVDATLEHVQDPQNTVKVQVCWVWAPVVFNFNFASFVTYLRDQD